MDDGIYGEVQDVSKRTRGQAIARFAGEAGVSFTEVRCTVRYLRIFTRQQLWDGPGKDRWADDIDMQHLIDHGKRLGLKESFARTPPEPPANWNPDESMPCWEFCDKSAPGAVKAYICKVRR